jgi:MFS family permease
MNLSLRVGRLCGRGGPPIFPGWWMILLGAVIYAVGGGIFFQALPVFFLPLKHDFQVSSAAVSLLYAAARLEGGLEGPLVGYLITRVGPRAMIIAGTCMSGGGMLLLALAPGYWSFFAIYVFVVCLGFNAGFFHPVSALVNYWFIRHRGVGIAWVSAAGYAGGMILAPLLSGIIQRWGWRASAAAAGALVLVVGLPAAWPIRSTPESMGLRPDGASPAPGPRDDASPASLLDEPDVAVREALRTRTFWVLMGTISTRLFVTIALSTHIVAIMVWGGLSEMAAAYVVSLYSLTCILATMGWGWIADRWSKPLVCSVGLGPMMLAMVGLVCSQATFWLYALAVGLGIVMGTASLNWILIGDLFGRRSYPTLRGLMGVGYGTATFLSPIFAGWIHDLTGSYRLVLVTFTAIALAAAVSFATLPAAPTRRCR